MVSLEGNILWVHGPYPAGSCSDITILGHGLKNKLLPGEMVFAYRGYGDMTCHTPNKFFGTDKTMASNIRARHEMENGKIKQWSVISSVFRHNGKNHSFCFYAVAQIVQLFLLMNPLFEVHFE